MKKFSFKTAGEREDARSIICLIGFVDLILAVVSTIVNTIVSYFANVGTFLVFLNWLFAAVFAILFNLFQCMNFQDAISEDVVTMSFVKKRLLSYGAVYLIGAIIFYFISGVVSPNIMNLLFVFAFVSGMCSTIIVAFLFIKHKESGDSSTMKMIAAALVFVFIVFTIFFSGVGQGSGGGNSGEKCKQCGDDGVYQSGMCKDCYEDFLDWITDNDKD